MTEIDEASMRLNRQVENLLNMSRLESGMLKPKPDWCDLVELVHSVLQKITPVGHHRIEFTPNEGLPLFKLDEGLLEQVFYNLISNAIQHTPEHSNIWIEVEHQDNDCVIRISDSGKGFTESEKAMAFEKFFRLPHSKPGGIGLGLSIAKGFVEAHGGQINLESNSQAGATFVIRIPAETSYLYRLNNE